MLDNENYTPIYATTVMVNKLSCTSSQQLFKVRTHTHTHTPRTHTHTQKTHELYSNSHIKVKVNCTSLYSTRGINGNLKLDSKTKTTSI
jgi:predicted metallopeptidase